MLTLQLLRKHYSVLILALAVGALTVLPQVLAIKQVPNFQGIYKTVNNDELYYLARAKEVIDGHSAIANPYLYEHKNEPPVQIGLPEYVLARPLAILNIDLHHGFLFYDFLLPALGVILSYGIVYFLTKRVLLSFFTAAFLHLNLFLYIFNRSPSPQFNFLFWLSLFFLWLRFIEVPSLTRAVLVGLNFGLLFYIYPYYWTFYVVFFAVYIFLNYVYKQPIPYKQYLIIFGITLLVAIPYFINLGHSVSLPYYDETLSRIGLITSHFPSGRKIVMWGSLLLVLILLARYKKVVSLNPRLLLFISGTVAAMVTVNHHLITGKNLQFSSHYWQLSVFVFVFATAYLLSQWLALPKPYKQKIILFTILALVIFVRPLKYFSYVAAGGLRYTPAEINQQRYAPVFEWLRRNTKPDEVVFANNAMSVLIPIYTANNVFFQSLAGLHFVSNGEVQERFVLNNFWDTFNPTYAVANRFNIWGAYYPTLYDHNQSKNKIRSWFGLAEKEYVKYPPEAIDSFLRLAEKVQSQDFATQLKKYRVNYFVEDKKNDRWPIDKLLFLKPVFQTDDLLIYEVTW